jgi:hypothetical protein
MVLLLVAVVFGGIVWRIRLWMLMDGILMGAKGMDWIV